MAAEAQLNKRSWLKWLFVGLWLAFWLYRTRYAMLDDALIHLRYAGYLHDMHRITYDGIHSSYGTSSILYVTLLAILRSFTQSPLLPKVLSCVCYLLLIALLMFLGSRFTKGTGSYAIWLGVLCTSLTPMAIRWLTDGMETSMVVLAVIFLAIAVDKEMHRATFSPLVYTAYVLFGTLLVLLRIELASLTGIAACSIFAGRVQHAPSQSRKIHLFGSTALVLGAALALLGVRLVLGSVLPDTALAKSSVPSLGAIGGAGHAIASSILFGISATLLTAISGLVYLHMLWRQQSSPKQYLVWIFANACFPFLIFMACTRGQAIQGIRYILWPLFFTTVWNALACQRLQQQRTNAGGRAFPWACWAYALFFVCLLPLDWHYAWHAMQGRAETFQAMRSAGLDRYRNTTVLAGDVGFIGYFTGANVCDMDGLVNGRQAAKETPAERIGRCAQQYPGVLFLADWQAQYVGRYMPLAGWVTCEHFDFVNIRGNDRHYVMVPANGQADPCLQPVSASGPPS